MEGDLRRVHQVRYSDRWRFDELGGRLLTLREIWVYLQDLPNDSRIVKKSNKGRPRWSVTDWILSDVIHALTGKPYPGRPKAVATSGRETPRRAAIKQRALAQRRKRQIEQRRAART